MSAPAHRDAWVYAPSRGSGLPRLEVLVLGVRLDGDGAIVGSVALEVEGLPRIEGSIVLRDADDRPVEAAERAIPREVWPLSLARALVDAQIDGGHLDAIEKIIRDAAARGAS